MKKGEFKNMSKEELESKLKEERQSLFNLRFQASIGQLANKLKIRYVRRNIARIQTELKGKEVSK